MKPVDYKTRYSLVNDVNTNFFVKAGAGSGKTTILVERMVSIIENTDITVDKICAITFTKKAANEFYDRFYKRLSERCDPNYKIKGNDTLGMPTEDTIRKCEDAIKNIDKCFLGTIDAFCNKVLSEYPTQCHIVPGSSILVTDYDKKKVYSKELNNIIKGKYGNDILDKFTKYNNVVKGAKRVFIDNIDKFLSHSDDSYKIFYYDPKSAEFNNYVNELNNHNKEISSLFNYIFTTPIANNSSNKGYKSLIGYKNLMISKWDEKDYPQLEKALKELFIFDDGVKLIKSVDKAFAITVDEYNNYIVGSGYEDFFMSVTKKPWYALCFDESSSPLVDINAIKYAYGMDFFISSYKEIANNLINNGTLTFYQNLLSLRNALKEDCINKGYLIDSLNEKYKTYLIDESQDTNPLQSEIFFYLASKNKNPVWDKNTLRDGSLFIVGDPKQSIYRFQSADIASYNAVESLFNTPNSKVALLSCNFRSSIELKKYYNHLFNNMLVYKDTPQGEIMQKDFEPIDNPTQNSNYSTLRKPVYDIIAPKRGNTNTMGEHIVELIKTLINSNNKIFKIKFDDNDNEYYEEKDIEYRDFMIVPNSKSNKISKITRELHEAHIPCYAEGEINFKNSDSLLYLYYLYSYIISGSNESFAGLLFTDYYNYTVKDIAEKSDEIRDIRNELDIFRTTINLNKPSYVLDQILNEKKLFININNDHIDLLFNALELVKAEEINNIIITLEDAKDYLYNLIFDSDIERITSLKNEMNVVSVANLHKVKGLENEFVILYGATGYKQKLPTERFSNKLKEGYIFDVENKNTKYFSTNLYDKERDLEQEFSDEENKRLAYVAATRPKCNLFILRQAKSDGTIGKENYFNSLFPEELNLNDYVIKVTGKEAIHTEFGSDGETIFKENEIEDLYSEKHVFKQNENYNIVSPSSLISKEDEYQNNNFTKESIIDEERIERSEIGILSHALLKMIVDTNGKLDIKEAVESLTDNYKEDLINMGNTFINKGFNQDFDGKYINNLYDYIKDKKCLTETPFVYKDGKDIVYGIIDLMFEDTDGKWVIIDYKTNKSTNKITEHYQKQLNCYKEAAEKIVGISVKGTYIYHIDI